MGIRDRLRRLENYFRDQGPTLEEVRDAWGRVAERARGKLRGEGVDEGRRARDRDTIERWARTGGVDLDTEAERAKAKLRSVDQAQP